MLLAVGLAAGNHAETDSGYAKKRDHRGKVAVNYGREMCTVNGSTKKGQGYDSRHIYSGVHSTFSQ